MKKCNKGKEIRRSEEKDQREGGMSSEEKEEREGGKESKEKNR